MDAPESYQPPQDATGQPGSLAAKLLFAACLAYFLWGTTVGWNNPLLDRHSFRQTQTAISSFYMVGTAPRLNYETPILGPPWSIPLEFPLYQWIVAAIVTVAKTPLDQTGRFVSTMFFLLTMIPANYLLVRLRFSRSMRLMILSLALASPFYIYWSRSFMVESTAMFLSMSYLATVVSTIQAERRAYTVIGSTVLGTLAALVKITTFAPFFLAAALILFADFVCKFRNSSLTRQQSIFRILAFMAITGPPVVFCLLWTEFANSQKELSYLGQYLTSDRLTKWNFGSIGQRFKLGVWYGIFRRANEACGSIALVVGAFGGLCLAGRRQIEFACCIAMYVSAPMIFINLHHVHDYYAYSNNLFLVAAIGICIASLLERGGAHMQLGVAALIVTLLAQATFYHRVYYPDQRTHRAEHYLQIGESIQELTDPDEVIIVLGCDWSSVIPYYAERRALMVPNWTYLPRPGPDYVSLVKDWRVGALVIREAQPEKENINAEIDANILAVLHEAGFHRASELKSASGRAFAIYDAPDD